MVETFKTIEAGKELVRTECFEKGCGINLSAPTEE